MKCQLIMSYKRQSLVFTQPQNDPLKKWSNRSWLVFNDLKELHTHLTPSALAGTMTQRNILIIFLKPRLKEKRSHSTPWMHHSNSEDMKQWQNDIFYWRGAVKACQGRRYKTRCWTRQLKFNAGKAQLCRPIQWYLFIPPFPFIFNVTCDYFHF